MNDYRLGSWRGWSALALVAITSLVFACQRSASTSPKDPTSRSATPDAKPAAPATPAAPADLGPLPPRDQLPAEYLACGCGCCLGEDMKKMFQDKCLYYAKGDDIRVFIQRDKRPMDCSNVGCSMGTRYRYCDAPNE